jgi:hypothetical protein
VRSLMEAEPVDTSVEGAEAFDIDVVVHEEK